MATTTTKFVSLENLALYNEKDIARMEAADAEVLAQSKKYADDLAVNYDAAGTAETKVKELADGAVKENTDAIAAINNEETGLLKQAKDYADGKDAEVQENIDALAGKVGEVAEGKTVVGMIAENAKAIEAHKTDIDAKVTTLVGEDVNKSVRTIANEELAAQLLSGEADADFQTLQELAQWLENHPEDVATINLNIANLQKLIGTLPEGATATDVVGYIAEAVAAEKSRAEGVESGLNTRLEAVEQAVGEGGSVDSQINAKIAELDADVTSADVEEGKGVKVQVVEVDGKLTTVAVTGNYDNAYDAKGSADSAKTEANTYTDTEVAKDRTRLEALETASATHALKTEVEAVAGDVDTLEADMTQAKTDIDAVEAKADANETAIANLTTDVNTKAAQTDLDNAVARVEAVEAWQNSMEEATSDDIDAMFQ